MTPEQRERFRILMEDRRRVLIAEGDLKIEPNQRDTTERPDQDDDQPLNEMVQAITSRRNQIRTQELRQLNAALRRLQEEPDDFGYCVDCDEPIPEKRLELMPYTMLCVACQSQREDPVRGASRRSLTDYR
ncbi:MAG: TraR/DksA family transcriptional regulator [Myxococcota bacterium]